MFRQILVEKKPLKQVQEELGLDKREFDKKREVLKGKVPTREELDWAMEVIPVDQLHDFFGITKATLGPLLKTGIREGFYRGFYYMVASGYSDEDIMKLYPKASQEAIEKAREKIGGVIEKAEGTV